jgi:hypothetical protein
MKVYGDAESLNLPCSCYGKCNSVAKYRIGNEIPSDFDLYASRECMEEIVASLPLDLFTQAIVRNRLREESKEDLEDHLGKEDLEKLDRKSLYVIAGKYGVNRPDKLTKPMLVLAILEARAKQEVRQAAD